MRKYKHFFNTMQYKAPKFFAPIIIIMCRHRRAHIEIWHSRLIVMIMRKICIIQRYGRIPYCHFFFFFLPYVLFYLKMLYKFAKQK